MHLTRRTFAKSLAAATVVGASPKVRAETPPLTLPLSAPLTHSDWMLKPGIPAGAEGVRHMLDACKSCGWSHVYWRAFDAGRATYRSKLCRSDLRAEDDCYFSPQNESDRAIFQKFSPTVSPERSAQIREQLAAIDYAAFDSLAAAVEYGHQIGLKIHAWATINEDDHGWGWRSEFAKAHPEFHWVRRDGRPYRSQLSFAFPQVRAYKLALVEELLAYGIDGLFIDWIRTGDVRDNPQTDAAGVADSGYEQPNLDSYKSQFGQDARDVANDESNWVAQRAQPQTEFMRALRQLVSKSAKQIPITVMVGHPHHYRGLLDPIDGNLRGLLLDVAAWAREGLIDAAVAAGYYRAGGSAETAFRALASETAGKCEAWHYAWVPQSPEEFEREFDAAVRLGAKRMLFWEADYIDDRPNAAALKAAMAARAT